MEYVDSDVEPSDYTHQPMYDAAGSGDDSFQDDEEPGGFDPDDEPDFGEDYDRAYEEEQGYLDARGDARVGVISSAERTSVRSGGMNSVLLACWTGIERLPVLRLRVTLRVSQRSDHDQLPHAEARSSTRHLTHGKRLGNGGVRFLVHPWRPRPDAPRPPDGLLRPAAARNGSRCAVADADGLLRPRPWPAATPASSTSSRRSRPNTSPRWKRSNNSRNKADSPVCLPLYGAIASPHKAAVASDSTTTIRRMGKPRPGFCERCWGHASWFSSVSGVSQRGTVDQLHVPVQPQPVCGHAGLQPIAHVVDQLPQHGLRQLGAGAAVGSRIGQGRLAASPRTMP